jgi:ribosomal protein S3AE
LLTIVVPRLCPSNSIAQEIGRNCEKAARSIFPLQVVMIRKVKVLKKPKFDCEWPP